MPDYKENYHIKNEMERGEKGHIYQRADKRLNLHLENIWVNGEPQEAAIERNQTLLRERGAEYLDKYLHPNYTEKKIRKYRAISEDTSDNSATEELSRENSYKSASTRRDKYQLAAKYMAKAEAVDTIAIKNQNDGYKKKIKKLDHILKAKRYIAEAKALSSLDEQQQKELVEMKIALAKYKVASDMYDKQDDMTKYKNLYDSHRRAYNALRRRRKEQTPEGLLLLPRYYGRAMDTTTEDFFTSRGFPLAFNPLDEHAHVISIPMRLHQTMQDFFTNADGTYDKSKEKQEEVFLKYKNAFLNAGREDTQEDLNRKITAKKAYIKDYADHLYKVVKKTAEDYGFHFDKQGHVDVGRGMPENVDFSKKFFQEHMDQLWNIVSISANPSTMLSLAERLMEKYPDQYRDLRETTDYLHEIANVHTILYNKTTKILTDFDIASNFLHANPMNEANKKNYKDSYEINSLSARAELFGIDVSSREDLNQNKIRKEHERFVETSDPNFLGNLTESLKPIQLDEKTEKILLPKRLHETMQDFFTQADGTYDSGVEKQQEVWKKYKKAFVQGEQKESPEEEKEKLQAKKDYFRDYTDHLYDILKEPAEQLGFRFTLEGNVDLTRGLPEDVGFPKEYVKGNMGKLLNVFSIAANTTTMHSLLNGYQKNDPEGFKDCIAMTNRLDELSSLANILDYKVQNILAVHGIFSRFTYIIEEGVEAEDRLEKTTPVNNGFIQMSRDELKKLCEEHQKK